MTLFVYITESCRSDIRTHSLSDEVEKFKDRVESSQSTSLFDPFPAPYLVKKKLGGRQGRLVTEPRNAGEHTVVVFLTVMIRGSREYEEFSHDPKGYGRNHFSDLVTQEQLQRYVLERTRVASTNIKPEPTEVEYSLLYDAFAPSRAGRRRDGVDRALGKCGCSGPGLKAAFNALRALSEGTRQGSWLALRSRGGQTCLGHLGAAQRRPTAADCARDGYFC